MAHNMQLDGYLRGQMQGKYPNIDIAIRDIVNAVTHYKDLKAISDQFMFNDGSSKQLINLVGTIPVMYKNNQYNIPVALWLQEQHPHAPPLCYVKPTSTMLVRQGKHVDANGRIYLSYLSEWRPTTHNLLGCIQMMTIVFGQEPPVFSKPTPSRAPPPVPNPNNMYLPSAQRPPYPLNNFTPQGPPTTNYQPTFGGGGTPYPPVPNSQPAPYPSTPNMTPTTSYPPYPSYQGNHTIQSTGYPSPSPVPPKDSMLDESMILASLRSAVNDKLKRRLRVTYTQAESELTKLKETESELKGGQEKLDWILKKLQDEISDADTAMTMLHQKNSELVKEIVGLEQRQENIEPDEFVMATTPVYRQVVVSFAEEQALEDTIYFLGEALHKGVVDVDAFLKLVRSLSRQQFILRAIIQKARKNANLESNY